MRLLALTLYLMASYEVRIDPLIKDHGPLGPINLSWLLLPHILSNPGHHTLGSAGSLLFYVSLSPIHLYFCKFLHLFTLISLCNSNYLVWPALFLVTAVDRRFCGSGTSWRCLVLLSRRLLGAHALHILQFLSDILSVQLVNCNLLFFSVHTTSIACLSVLVEGSLLCGSS